MRDAGVVGGLVGEARVCWAVAYVRWYFFIFLFAFESESNLISVI